VLWGKVDDAKNERLPISCNNSESCVDQDVIGAKVETETNLLESFLSENRKN
jgi:hypothetical protein